MGRTVRAFSRSKGCIWSLYCNMLIDSATWFTIEQKGERVGLSGKMGSTMVTVDTGDRIIRQSYGLVPFLGTE